jgi:hypothetical protein
MEFNTIKSALIKISVAHQIGSVQSLNAERRKLANSLQAHSTNLIGEVALNAVKTQGDNRLEDANKLLEMGNNLRAISDKVEDQKKQNEQKRLEARGKLEQTRQLLAIK